MPTENGRVGDYPDQPFAPNSLLGLLTGDPAKGLAGLFKCAQEQLPERTDAAAHIADHGLPERCDPDSYYFFSSMMWSDAGIVSTVDDLNTFIRALARGKLFKDGSTLETMLELPAGEKKGYGRGIVVDRTGDDVILLHGGGAASLMIYQTKADISFIGTMNDAGPQGRPRMGEVFGGFQEVLAKHGIDLRSPF